MLKYIPPQSYCMCTASLLQEAKKANTMLSSLDIVFTRHLSRSSEWWNLHLPIIIVPAHRSASSCIYLPLLPGPPAPRWGRWSARPSPNHKKKKRKTQILCLGSLLDSVPSVAVQHTNNLSYWAVLHSYKYFKVNLSI